MAAADQIVCNGHIITLPTLEVVKTIPKMSAGTNIDWLIHIYFSRRDFVRCKLLIERELYKHLNPEYLYFIKGLIDREEGNNIEALRNLQKAIDLNSKNIETYKEIGKTLFLMGRYNQALGVFREAEELSPRPDHEIFHFIGELLHRSAAARNQLEVAREEETEAKLYFQKAVQYGKKLESFQRLAEMYRKQKEYGKAIEVLESCLLLSPENTEVLTEIGVLYLKVNETQKAFDRLLEVINVDKTCPRGLLAFGAILQSRNDVDSALGKYKEIAAAEPDIPELWNNIGLCFFKKRKFIVAISSLRKTIWLSPLNYNALYNLSLIYVTAQQYASAFHTLAAAINLRKDSAECYMLLGICLRKLEDTENAFTAFARSSEIMLSQKVDTNSAGGGVGAGAGTVGARNPLIHLNFALFCIETGRIAMANEQYNRFLSGSQDLLLPTEYKFQSTKLKSLLKISTNNIFTSPTVSTKNMRKQLHHQRSNDCMMQKSNTNPTARIRNTITATGASVKNENDDSNNNGTVHRDRNDSEDLSMVPTASTSSSPSAPKITTASLERAQAEIPLEVNAVVNANLSISLKKNVDNTTI